MTDNDYIAEYVKERCPSVLGADYAVWRLGRGLVEFANTIREVIRNTPPEDIRRITNESEEQAESEVSDADSD